MKVEISLPLLKSLLTLSTIIEARDAYTGGHTWRVSRYARILAAELGLDADQVTVAAIGGLLHDLGKVGVPDAILNKPGPLDPPEMETMRAHPRIGAAVVAQHPLVAIVEAAVTEHHERPDGKGYPANRPGADLSVTGRILAVADAFDAMTSTRPYRRGMAKEKALAIVAEERGRQFDPGIADSFLAAGARGALDHVLGHSSEGTPLLECGGCGPVIALDRSHGEGAHVFCPVCRGDYVLHAKGDGFELEWSGKVVAGKEAFPLADLENVDAFLREGPSSPTWNLHL